MTEEFLLGETDKTKDDQLRNCSVNIYLIMKCNISIKNKGHLHTKYALGMAYANTGFLQVSGVGTSWPLFLLEVSLLVRVVSQNAALSKHQFV